jgi:tetratricopeptide (TPR) repeat protein
LLFWTGFLGFWPSVSGIIKTMGWKVFLALLMLFLVSEFGVGTLRGDTPETNAPPAKGTNAGPDALSGVPDALRAYLLVQEQLRNTQMAIEQSRQESEAAAARTADQLETRLAVFEKTLTSQRLDELKEMQTSNRMVLNAAGIFASIAFVVLLFTALLHWSAVNRLAALAASLPAAIPALGVGHQPAALGPGEAALADKGVVEESTRRFLGTIERLEQRIHEMEASFKTSPSLSDAGSGNGHHEPADEPADASGTSSAGPSAHGQERALTALLGKGETMLKLDQAEGALACFEEALAIDPANAEAMVRKGLALERLQRLDEAVVCYDRAIAADSSLTMAYLYKGGVFNRMERFSEALECYEKALKAQEKAQVSELVG